MGQNEVRKVCQKYKVHRNTSRWDTGWIIFTNGTKAIVEYSSLDNIFTKNAIKKRRSETFCRILKQFTDILVETFIKSNEKSITLKSLWDQVYEMHVYCTNSHQFAILTRKSLHCKRPQRIFFEKFLIIHSLRNLKL